MGRGKLLSWSMVEDGFAGRGFSLLGQEQMFLRLSRRENWSEHNFLCMLFADDIV